MRLLRHFLFLKEVLLHSITAFGGPQAHLSLMQSRFADKRKDVSAEELMEYNALCQMLPGASSTQTIILIGYKRGGYTLAFLTLVIWLFPACTVMTLLALLYSNQKYSNEFKWLLYLKPMTIAIIISATMLLFKKAITNTITTWIFVAVSIIVLIGFTSPWTIPIVILLAGIATNFSQKRIPNVPIQKAKIKTQAFILFLFLFLVAGFLSEKSTRQNWPHQKLFNLFETNYRFGTFVFGGGDVLIPIMYEQYVTRPSSASLIQSKRDVIKINSDDFLLGTGIGRAVPGPVWSFTSYMGAIAVKDKGIAWQILGAFTATLGAFLPSFLIVLFAFPLWQNLKKYAIVLRSLEGINAAVVGIMLGASFYLSKDLFKSIGDMSALSLLPNLSILFLSTYLLYTKKMATHWLVFSIIAIGLLTQIW